MVFAVVVGRGLGDGGFARPQPDSGIRVVKCVQGARKLRASYAQVNIDQADKLPISGPDPWKSMSFDICVFGGHCGVGFRPSFATMCEKHRPCKLAQGSHKLHARQRASSAEWPKKVEAIYNNPHI